MYDFTFVRMVSIISVLTTYFRLFLISFRSQGVGAGIAVGVLFLPAATVVATWFTRRRAAAMGIVASGSSIGAVILPIALEKLIPLIGFGWSVRVIALIQLTTL